MKKYLYTILALLLVTPVFVQAVSTATWSTSDFTGIYPTKINGSSPNVGIGITTPTTLLHVGTSTIGKALATFQANTEDIEGFDLILQKSRGDITTPGSLTVGDEVGGRLIFRGYGAQSFLTGAEIKGILEDTVSTTRMPTGIQFMTKQTTSLGEKMRLTATGKLGIGTTTPFSKLQVNGSGVGTGQLFALVNSGSTTVMQALDNGQIGIGTANPTKLLDVNGTGRFGDTLNAFALQLDEMSGGGITCLEAIDNGTVIRSTSGLPCGSSQWTTNGTSIYYNTGNVGIGTTTPFGKLSIVNTSGIALAFDAGSTNGASDVAVPGNQGLRGFTGSTYGGGGPAFQIWGDTSAYKGLYFDAGLVTGSDINFRTSPVSSVVAMIVKQSTGRVGIGSTSPYAKLSVHGLNGDTNPWLFAVASSTASATTTHFVVLNTGNVGVGTSSPWGQLSVNKAVGVNNDRIFTAGIAGNEVFGVGQYDDPANPAVYFKSPNGGTTPYVRLFAGPAGGGNLSFNASFTYFNSSSGTIFTGAGPQIQEVNNNTPSSAATQVSSLPFEWRSEIWTGSTNANRIHQIYAAVSTTQNNVDRMAFVQNRANQGSASAYETLSLLYDGAISSGRVGIGSTTPWAKLSVNAIAADGAAPQFVVGSTTATNFIVASSGKVGIGSTTPWGLLSINPNGITGPSFVIGSSTGTKFIVANSGNVGIGTLTPGALLDVAGNAVVNGNLNVGLGNGTAVDIGSDMIGADAGITVGGQGLAILQSGNFYYGRDDSSGGGITVDGYGGSVGIASTTPWKTLSIAGDMVLTGGLFDSLSSAGANGYVLQSTGSATQWVATSTLGIASSLTGTLGQVAYFSGTNSAVGTSSIFISATGNVGVGTSTPSAKLSVNNYSSGASTAPLFAIASSTGTGATTTVFYVGSTGNIGVNRTDPVVKFQVDGGVAADCFGNDTVQPGNCVVLGHDGSSSYGAYLNVNASFTIHSNVANGATAVGTILRTNQNLTTAGAKIVSFKNQSVEKAFIDKDGLAYFAGSVGVATSTPWGKLSVGTYNLAVDTPSFVIASSSTGVATSTQLIVTNGNVGIGTTTPNYGLTLTQKSVLIEENNLATSTSMTVDFKAGNNQLIRTGTSATTIAFSNQYPGANIVLTICNPNATAGAVTFTGVLWPAGTVPTQTTTANKCDIWSFRASYGTSTLIIMGGQTPNF